MTPTEFMFNIHCSAVGKPYPVTIAETGKRLVPGIMHLVNSDATAINIRQLLKFILILLELKFQTILLTLLMRLDMLIIR